MTSAARSHLAGMTRGEEMTLALFVGTGKLKTCQFLRRSHSAVLRYRHSWEGGGVLVRIFFPLRDILFLLQAGKFSTSANFDRRNGSVAVAGGRRSLSTPATGHKARFALRFHQASVNFRKRPSNLAFALVVQYLVQFTKFH